MILEPIRPKILSVQRIPDAHEALLRSYGADPTVHHSLGLVTCDQDDSTYVALDEATKHSPVDVVYARSFYAGAAHSSGPLSGEILGVIAASGPEEIEEGLRALVGCLEHDACFYSGDERGETALFPHVITSLGEYLSKEAGLNPGDPMAYLVAPPMEGTLGIDRALKEANVRAVKIFGPPTETNYCAAWLTGALAECEAAASAFAEAVIQVARTPQSRLSELS
ncbi:MAG: ethanolamine utilization protein EutL [Candidatus Paceibacteria bacterium]|jgi:ethanolamine utilization protein EutL